MKALRKSTALMLLVVLRTTLLAGCQTNQNNSQAAASTATSASPTPGHSAGNSSGSEVIKEGIIQKDGNVILKELAFVYNDHTVAISDIVDDEKLESMLGNAVEKKSHTYSKYDDLNMDRLLGFTEKRYKFSGLEIKTIDATEDKKFYIFHIKMTDSKYSTVRNIKVGDSVKKLREAYPEGHLFGNGTPGEEAIFQYETANYADVMTFHIKDAKVESILMYSLLD